MMTGMQVAHDDGYDLRRPRGGAWGPTADFLPSETVDRIWSRVMRQCEDLSIPIREVIVPLFREVWRKLFVSQHLNFGCTDINVTAG
jgi:hypothetical protein